jgi:hypothetical protein
MVLKQMYIAQVIECLLVRTYAKYEGGFGMQFTYKGFDLSTDFVFKQGNYTYNYMWSNMNADGNAQQEIKL